MNTADTDKGTVTVRVNLSVTVDPAWWAIAQGHFVDADGNFTMADLRTDVRQYFLNLVQTSSALEDANGTAALTP